MYKTIVVPVDGSELASRAVPPAAWLADRFGAELHLVTTTFAADTGDADEALRCAAGDAGSTPVRTEVIRHKFPARGILDVARADDQSLLCLSTRGVTGVHSLLLGSVSDEVVRNAVRPLVLVGPECDAIPPGDPRLLVCIDGSDASFAVLPEAGRWADEVGFGVDVVLVADAHTVASFRASTEAQLERAVEALGASGVQATARLEVSTTPARAIVDVADDIGASAIALGTQGAGGLFSEALGHVATEIVRHASVPVLVVPVRDE